MHQSIFAELHGCFIPLFALKSKSLSLAKENPDHLQELSEFLFHKDYVLFLRKLDPNTQMETT